MDQKQSSIEENPLGSLQQGVIDIQCEYQAFAWSCIKIVLAVLEKLCSPVTCLHIEKLILVCQLKVFRLTKLAFCPSNGAIRNVDRWAWKNSKSDFFGGPYWWCHQVLLPLILFFSMTKYSNTTAMKLCFYVHNDESYRLTVAEIDIYQRQKWFFKFRWKQIFSNYYRSLVDINLRNTTFVASIIMQRKTKFHYSGMYQSAVFCHRKK